ncbi:hypothetical protein NLC29_00050 [Candidatus Aminicenantes bacterium AH-873-B07]|nr:hypothetical protein [Candidatus Aminicenantes bacterium AH-873-B07]
MPYVLFLIFVCIGVLSVYIILIFFLKEKITKEDKAASVVGSALLVIVTALLFVATERMARIAGETKKIYEILHKDKKSHEEQLQYNRQQFETALLLLQSSNEIYKNKELRDKVEKYISENFHGDEGEIFKIILAQKINMIPVSPQEVANKRRIKDNILAIKYIGWMYIGNYNENRKDWIIQKDRFPDYPHKSSLEFEYEKMAPMDLKNKEFKLTTRIPIRTGPPIVYEEDPKKTYLSPIKGSLEKGNLVKIKRIDDRIRHPENPNVRRIWAEIQY